MAEIANKEMECDLCHRMIYVGDRFYLTKSPLSHMDSVLYKECQEKEREKERFITSRVWKTAICIRVIVTIFIIILILLIIFGLL